MEILKNIGEFFESIELNVIHRIHMSGFKELIDIILLATMFYFVIKFIMDRRAARLFYGLVVMVAIFIISYNADMKATNLIFGQFYQLGFLAIIIMFQPEIRSGLEKIGTVSKITNIISISNNNKSSSYINTSIDQIAKTAMDLSAEKTGALMVIEGETKLGEYIKTGTLINAQLSPQLLKNIFFNKAPLHDGAVILRAYRVYAAGCYLPLSAQDNIDENMGTRHRAGIGITEVSDAVVVIVSEETGRVSIAVDGKITQGYNYRTLKKELSKLLIPNTNKLKDKNENSKSLETKENK